MAQTKRKRRSKHRGTPAGKVEARGRTSRPASPQEKKKEARAEARQRRLNQRPTWKSSFTRAGLAAGLLFLFLLIAGPKQNRALNAVLFTLIALAIYVPAGYYIDLFLWKRRQRRKD
jgi:cation transport ATPase